jgi:hypothetical protein
MESRNWLVRGAVLILWTLGSMPGCSPAPEAPESRDTAAATAAVPQGLEDMAAQAFEDTETHADLPPHGGIVASLGQHVAHAEILLVPDTGELTVYILDAEGQPGKRIAQPSILVDVETSARLVSLELRATPLDGERVGDASRFTSQSDDLLRAGEGVVTMRWVLVDGQVFSDTVVPFGAME